MTTPGEELVHQSMAETAGAANNASPTFPTPETWEVLYDALAAIGETLEKNGIPRQFEKTPYRRTGSVNHTYTRVYGELGLQAAKTIRATYEASLGND